MKTEKLGRYGELVRTSYETDEEMLAYFKLLPTDSDSYGWRGDLKRARALANSYLEYWHGQPKNKGKQPAQETFNTPPELAARILRKTEWIERFFIENGSHEKADMLLNQALELGRAEGLLHLYFYQDRKRATIATGKGQAWRQAAIEQWHIQKGEHRSLAAFCESIAGTVLMTNDGQKEQAPKYRQVYEIMRAARKNGDI